MVEISLRTDPYRLIWYAMEDSHLTNTDASRWRINSRQHVWRPPTDVYETTEAIVVRVEIAGMRESDFKLSLQERLLLIRGVRPDVLERRAYHQLEIPFGEFASEVELSVPVVAEQVTAEYKEGFLKIILPKARPQQIHVGE